VKEKIYENVEEQIFEKVKEKNVRPPKALSRLYKFSLDGISISLGFFAVDFCELVENLLRRIFC
jgi:hypothetical protein